MWEGKLDLCGSKKKQFSCGFLYGNKYLCFINCGEFLEWLHCCLHFKKHIPPWRFFFAYWVLSHYWSDYNHSTIDLFQLKNLRSYYSVNPQKNVHNSSETQQSYNTYCNIVVIVINRVRSFYIVVTESQFTEWKMQRKELLPVRILKTHLWKDLNGVVISCWTYKPGETEIYILQKNCLNWTPVRPESKPQIIP